MSSTPHLKSPSSFDLFEDDFAEASIEAISFAAMRNIPSKPPHPADDHSFPTPSPSLPSRATAFRRALSSLSSHPNSTSSRRPRPSDLGLNTTHSLPRPSLSPSPTLSTSSPRLSPPVNLKLAPFPSTWYFDVLALPHNALRAELADLTAMLASLSSTAPHLLLRMRALADWWPKFDALLADYFAFESTVLMPWIYRGGAAHDLQDLRQKMASHAAYINDMFLEVHNVLALFNANPDTDVLPLLIRTVREFVPSLLQYFDVEERYLPSVIQAGHTETDAFNVTRLMTRKLDAVLLTRWIPSRKERNAIRRMYMTPSACIKYFAKRRKAYVTHLDLVHVVRDTVLV